jgi:RND family efflux transporter MFP subunit
MNSFRRNPLLSLLAACLAAASACKKAGPDAGAAPPGMPVKIEDVRLVAVDDSTEYVATLRSRGQATLMPQVEGHVTRILVKPGDRVAAGTAIMQIDPAKQQASVRSQEDTQAARRAAVRLARQQFERVQGLFGSGITSQQDLDQAKAALDAAEAELRSVSSQVREQQTELGYYRVSAPTAGVVGDIPVRVGDRVTVQTMLTTINAPGSLEAYISVPVERAAQVRMGLPVRLVDGAGAVLATSAVSFVSPQVDDATQTVLVKAVVGNASLRPEQFVRARLVWSTREGPVVPVLAVSRVSGQFFAFVAQQEKGGLVAHQRPLKIGDIQGNDYVVLDGLKKGDRVIVSGTQFLRDGAPVSPLS